LTSYGVAAKHFAWLVNQKRTPMTIIPARLEMFAAYITERESIRLRRKAGQLAPWTADPIFSAYKFTNVHRQHDHTTNVLCEQFYRKQGHTAPYAACLMNAATFRHFSLDFCLSLGWQEYWNPDRIRQVANSFASHGRQVFPSAYVISNHGQKLAKLEVVLANLAALNDQAQKLVDGIRSPLHRHTWQHAQMQLEKVPGFGGTGFMAKEVLLDTFHTHLWHEYDADGGRGRPTDYETWTPVGPGGRRGAARLVGLDGGKDLPLGQALGVIMAAHRQLRQLGRPSALAAWQGAGNPALQDLVPHDVQFCLCEFDKYMRAKLGEGAPKVRFVPRPSNTAAPLTASNRFVMAAE
jgi:hypothetical protein